MTAAGIVVLGSANMDLVVRVDSPPLPGETVFGRSFGTFPGGKGLNQAVAAARAGGRVSFIGRVGADAFGGQIESLLAEEGIVSHLRRGSLPTGTAHITVEESGQNSIIVVSGANGEVGPSDLEAAELAGSGWLLTQLELNQETVSHGLELARAAGVRTVLTPAPARALPDSLLAMVDLLVPNQGEACLLAGVADPLVAAERLSRVCGQVVVTLGGDGAVWARDGSVAATVSAAAVPVVDTTAAGDTFLGALAVALDEGAAMPEAMGFATRAAGIAVGRPGATTSMPSRQEIGQLDSWG